mmetsp:Transcript_6228/g.5349  ORF Transcript_6228/g.5349 Transcript_6228/m.5349 type:complete len:189 (-) Transcript_6228:13-579(-)
MFRVYNKLLTKYPLPTKMATSGFLFGVGDTLCQYIEQHKSDKFQVNFKRLARFSFFGCFLGAPILNFHYGTILQRISTKTTPMATLVKVAFDQTFFATFFITYIFTVMPLLEGKGLEVGKQAVQEKLWPSLLTNWKIWPAVQFLNFYLVPLRFHMLVVNSVAVFWNAYMSWMINHVEEVPTLETELKK